MSWFGNQLLPALEEVLRTEIAWRRPDDLQQLADWLRAAGHHAEAAYIQAISPEQFSALLRWFPHLA